MPACFLTPCSCCFDDDRHLHCCHCVRFKEHRIPWDASLLTRLRRSALLVVHLEVVLSEVEAELDGDDTAISTHCEKSGVAAVVAAHVRMVLMPG